MDPEISPKLAQKLNQIHVDLFIGVFDFYKKTKTMFYIRKTHTGKSVSPILEPILDPKIGLTIAKNGVKKWTHFRTCFSDFRSLFWVHFGSHFGVKEAMMRQDGLKKDFKSLKVLKSSNCKKSDFPMVEPYFLSVGGS